MDSFSELNIEGLDALFASTDAFLSPDLAFLSIPSSSHDHSYRNKESQPPLDQEHYGGMDSSTQPWCTISWKVPHSSLSHFAGLTVFLGC